ncbi:xylulokinase [Brooklawnia cerclae]|uniref:Sugar (Pentulose or hexulose) kinase n=1 Tax=Brooklawnia cerclae TaxID=349934 RepID=A0ABX0SHX5_9ACTN|nr:FGGY family carbohydrate kinase [Brooklawnia cerclae]NIH57954.1 sugar (pentulose or hexulose) kinase [Brooklawnia cerclae]
MADLVIGLDVGTSGTKTVLMADDGTALASASWHYAIDRRSPVEVEQDAEDWWTAIVRSVRAVTDGIDPARIGALAMSVQGGTLVNADRDGNPLAPARSWLDSRAAAAAQALDARFGAHGFYERTGWKLGPRYNAAQIADMRSHDHDLFAATGLFLSTHDFLAMRLTGRPCLDRNSAGITQLTNAAERRYDPDILEAIGIDESVLPGLVDPGEAIGTLTPRAAADLGLPRDVVVVAGGHDQYCAALGAGALDASTLVLSTGTAWVVLGASAVPLPDPRENLSFSDHVLPGLWGAFCSLLNGGSSLEWVRGLWGTSGEPLSFDAVTQDVLATPAGSDGLMLVPHFGATVPVWDERSRGGFVGMDLTHERRHFVRATLEGICYEAATLVALHRGVNPQVSAVRVMGGATQSPVWPRIIADVLGEPIDVLREPDAACRGAAMLAAAADPARIGECCLRMMPGSTRLEPGPDSAFYQDAVPRRAAFVSSLDAAQRQASTPERN